MVWLLGVNCLAVKVANMVATFKKVMTQNISQFLLPACMVCLIKMDDTAKVIACQRRYMTSVNDVIK